jgi:hypothetical protein
MRDTRISFLLRLFLAVIFLPVLVMTGAVRSMCAQEKPVPSTDTTTLHVASRLVVLDVVVIDRNGKFVSNLDRSQFTVTEDKVPQPIRNFDPPDGHEMPAGSAGKMVVESSADLPKIGNAVRRDKPA